MPHLRLTGGVRKEASTAKWRAPTQRRFFSRRWLVVVCVPLAALGLWTGHLLHSDNFHAIIAGEAYRSGQMRSNDLVRCIQRYGIRSLVNLRGEHPEQVWYREEVRAAASQQVVHRSVALSSRKSVTKAQADELAALFKMLPKPLLVHCDGGADRTAFAAALYAAHVGRASPEAAEKEFSMWYGYLPLLWKEKAQLRQSFHAHVK